MAPSLVGSAESAKLLQESSVAYPELLNNTATYCLVKSAIPNSSDKRQASFATDTLPISTCKRFLAHRNFRLFCAHSAQISPYYLCLRDHHRPGFNTLPNWRIGGSTAIIERNVRTHCQRGCSVRRCTRVVAFHIHGQIHSHRACLPALVSYMTNTNGSADVCFSSQYLRKAVSLSNPGFATGYRRAGPAMIRIVLEVIYLTNPVWYDAIRWHQVLRNDRATIAKCQGPIL